MLARPRGVMPGLASQLGPLPTCLPLTIHGLTATVSTPLLTGAAIAVPANSAVLGLLWSGRVLPAADLVLGRSTLHTVRLDRAKSIEMLRPVHSGWFVLIGWRAAAEECQDDLRAFFF